MIKAAECFIPLSFSTESQFSLMKIYRERGASAATAECLHGMDISRHHNDHGGGPFTNMVNVNPNIDK